MKIHFPEDVVRQLVEHARASPGVLLHYGEKAPRGLWLVGDKGVYLMSSGDPPPTNTDTSRPANQSLVAYAEEIDPLHTPEWYEVKRAAFGGDDGCNPLNMQFADSLLANARNGLVAIYLTKSRVAIARPDADRWPMKR